MSSSRIMAINALLPTPPVIARTSSAPHGSADMPADLAQSGVRLEGEQVFEAAQPDMTVLMAPDAMSVDRLADEAHAGDVLLVKVLSTSPQLSLERLAHVLQSTTSAPSFLRRSTPTFDGGTATMIPDQTAMLRMSWAPPDAALMATNWRVLVLEHLRELGGSIWPHPAGAEHVGIQQFESTSMCAPIERWLFHVQAWSGLPISLHLLSPRHRHRQNKGSKPSQSWGLCVNGILPGVGHIELQAQLSTEGACILILAKDDQAWQRLKDVSLAVSKAVTRVGWRLRDLRILRELDAEDAQADGHVGVESGLIVMPKGNPHASALPLALFRVTAEVLMTLGALGAGISPMYR